MNNRIYIIPSLTGWTFRTSSEGYGLWSGNGGPGVSVTSETSVTEIAERVKGILWLHSRMSNEDAESISKEILKLDFKTMIQESGTDIQHQSPRLPGWLLKISDYGSGLWYKNGSGVQLTSDTTMTEIIAGVRLTLKYSATTEETEYVVQEMMKIDFKSLILNAFLPRAALLLENCKANNTALIESICSDIKLLAVLQNSNNKALVDEICDLVKNLN